ncbi:MAG: hypothetical protein HY889_04615 [Deltaproteobacteria bacterium]|nr:hypothetical protein [Deltaproteobacteria bacterium]
MKRIFLVITTAILAGCSAQNAVKRGELPEKKELEVWQVMRHAGEGKKRFNIEDTWYIYCMDLTYVSGDRPRQMTNESMGGQCPIEKAAYLVYDKETKTVVRDAVLSQERCADCHRR